MPKSKKQRQIQGTAALSKWEGQGVQLAKALSTYLQSCTSLEALSSNQSGYESDVALRIDHSLNTLHTKLADELSQSRVTLARIRNKISSRFHSLPNEVLAQIFKEVVYSPAPGDARAPCMTKSLKMIYGRLHSLLGVCSVWRNFALGLGDLWSVIPAACAASKLITPAATSLALERSQAFTSGNRPVHLAVVLPNIFGFEPPSLTRSGSVPQFTSINIEAQYYPSLPEVCDLLEELLRSQVPSITTDLAIYQHADREEGFSVQLPNGRQFVATHMSNEVCNQFNSLIAGLSRLRLRNINIHWNTITFSDKLVEIHLQSIALGGLSKLNELLLALQSAPELCDVKLISVFAFPMSRPSPVKVSLPKLQSLLLDNLKLKVLEHVLATIMPGSYCLKVGLSQSSSGTRHSLDEELGSWDEPELEEYGDPDNLDDSDNEETIDLLSGTNIHTLFLDSDRSRTPNIDRDHLRSLLKSLPTLKALIMDGWKWDSKDILALTRSKKSAFPNLAELYIINSGIPDPDRLLTAVASHPLEKFVLEGHLYGGKAGQVAQKLKEIVPDFQMRGSIPQTDEFNYNKWRLW